VFHGIYIFLFLITQLPMPKRLGNAMLLIVALAIIAAVWIFVFRETPREELVEDVEEVQGVQDVGEAIPETSPTKNTNPFEGTYQNPFK